MLLHCTQFLPLTIMDDCIPFLGDARIFSTLYADRCSWRVEINDASWDTARFPSRHGVFRFKWMLFGWHTTHDIMKVRPGGPQNTIILPFNADKHISHVRRVWSLLLSAEVRFNLHKSNLTSEGRLAWAFHTASKNEICWPYYWRNLQLDTTVQCPESK